MDRSELKEDQKAEDEDSSEQSIDLEVDDGFIGGISDFREGG
jgi:hypothetical protein